MIKISSLATATAVASLLLMGAASAQTTAPAKTEAPKAAPAAKTEKAPVMHSAASLECSKEADAKGLHGKERKKFRSECKATAAKTDKPAK
ncbi:MAG: PsiF family protein [Bradyrhizobium sp.]